MNFRERVTAEYEKRKGELLVFVLLLGFGFFINRGVELKGLYMDDLYLWSCYGEQSFREFVFPVGGTRFRFIFYLAAWLELLFLGGHVALMVPFNIILNSIIAFCLYRIAAKLSRGRRVVSLSLAAAFLLSRLSYYQISQFYGLMESLALWAAVGMLYFLYRYINGRNPGDYLAADFLYFTVSFIHERYMALFPLLLLGLILGKTAQPHLKRSHKRDKLWPLFLIAMGTMALIQLIRLIMIGTLLPAGTGGTEVSDTFHFMDAIGYAWEQVGYVFGINTGPEHLCGIPFQESSRRIRILVLAADGVIGLSIVFFIAGLIKNKKDQGKYFRDLLLLISFVILNIGSSSVTIRVEMRWVYVVYAAALLIFAYMSSVMGKAGVLVILYSLLLIPTEVYYRGGWEKLYYWPNQLRYNSLAEETYGRYGDDIFQKQVYIIGNKYELSEFTAKTFLKVYGRKSGNSGLPIKFIESAFDLEELGENDVLLREDPEHNAYQDVTAFAKEQQLEYVYGSYADGWVDEEARIVFTNDETKGIVLRFYYPGEITGNEVCRIRVNGERLTDMVFTDNSMEYEISAAPHQTISLELSCNFYVKDAKEQRGKDHLAMIVGMGPKHEKRG